ncbi:hypothetical protein EJ110_NYTH03699 [Nymphaea thermarum]|nr:hypothetical protein EJ110_NYTH03699 [Nymphaea thermarum]
MAEFHRKKSNGYKRSYPGCMGGMVNLFDLGVSGNKLLADRPHRHGSDLSGSRLEISKKAPDPTVYDDEYLKEKPQIAYEPRRGSLNKTSNGTPMKMLLAQELSKEMDPKRNPPSVVARLMGLDAVPAQAPVSGRQKNKADGFLESTTLRNHEHCRHLSIELDNFNRSRSGPRYQCREHDSEMKRLPDRSLSHSSISEKEECKDVYEVWQSSKMEKIGHGSLQKATYDDLDEKKMDVVRQKFMEAKRLATDEKLRQSKEFQDALEVLSSNRDLFLKFLQESNPLFSKQLNNLQTVEPPLQSKRITVLKPSKKVARNGSWEQLKVGERCVTSESKTGHFGRTQELVHHSPNKQLSKAKGLEQNRVDRNSVFENQNGFHIRPPGKAESASRPTKIVVLKPSARMTQDIRTAISSPPLSPGPRGGDSFSSSPEEYCDSAAEENNDSQGIEGAHMPGSIINQAMHAFGTRDEPMISSNLSNGYVGDESSFNRSDNEYVEGGNLSDSDVMTPTSRHSWEFINRCSPYSSSSLSRASCSPESSVSREAKKRLSERWALIACGNPEYRHLRRSSSTLGEMLAIPEVKNPTDSVGETSEESPSMSSGRMHAQNDVQEASFVSSDKVVEDGAGEGSFRNLLRSRSVPSSSNAVDSVPSEGEASKAEVQMPLAKTEKPKSGKSFRGKVSSLFFSKNRKSSKEKCLPSPSPSSESCQANKEIYNGAHDLQQPPVRNNRGDGQSPLQSSDELCRTPASTLSPNGQKGGGFVKCADFLVVALYVPPILEQAEQGDIPSENADQPSPVSVLEPPFEDELSPTGVGRSISESEARHGSLSLKMGTSRISPESLATILSWDDPIPVDGRLGKNIGPEAATIASMVVEEEQRFLFVENVLTAAGLDGKQPATTVFLERWHSPSSPLDPSLLDSFDDWNERFININAAMSEAAKLRRAVLERKLLFDCMNAALLDMAGPALDVNPWLRARIWTGKGMTLAGNQLVEEVWRRVKKIFSGEEAVSTGVTATESRDCVDKLLKKEVAGREWDWLQLEWVEVDVIGKEIENDLFKNLIDDIVSDFVRMRLH